MRVCSQKINILQQIFCARVLKYTQKWYTIYHGKKSNYFEVVIMTKFVYADNAATTPILPEVLAAMQPCFETAWGNPSSQHSKGNEAKELLDDARERIAKVFSCKANEIYFTSCGTESDNWAIKGAAMRMKK